MKTLRIAALAAAGALAVAGVLAWANQDSGSAGPGPAVVAGPAARPDARAETLPAISVVAARPGTIVAQLDVSGLVEAAEQVYVQPEIEGQAIAGIHAEVGDVVRAGQTLARLADDSLKLKREQLEAQASSAKANIAQYRAQIVEAQSAADEAERSRERSAKLAQRGVVSQASLDQAAAAATAARARLSAAQQGLNAARAQAELVAAQIADLDYSLARTRIAAPVDGLVIARNARLGAIASAVAQPMFVIIRDGALELRADVAEGDLFKVRAGQSARVSLSGLESPLTGRVRLVEPTVDAATRLGRVRIALDEPGRARAGMFADARIVIGEYHGLTLPVAAVTRSGGAARVLRVDDGLVSAVTVSTGVADEAHIAITGGIESGQWVVARAGAFVRPGDRIRPQPDGPGAAAAAGGAALTAAAAAPAR